MPTDLELARFCSDSYTNVQSFDFVDEGTETGVFFCLKRLPDRDVLVFRGSITLEDWWRDLDAEMVFEYGLGYVHAGFNRNLAMVHSILDNKLRHNPVITGHSLGAGRAAIFGAMLASYADRPNSIVLFGCPRAGTPSLAGATKDIPVSSYRNRQDPVTEVPISIPQFPYAQVRPMISLDGETESEYNDLLKDHHISAYVNGLEKLNGELSSSK